MRATCVFLVFGLSIGLAGCGGDSDDSADPSSGGASGSGGSSGGSGSGLGGANAGTGGGSPGSGGGSSGSGGGSSGSGGGSSGTGGSSGGGSLCEMACQRTVCPDDPAPPDCAADCAGIAARPECQNAANAFYTCINANEVTCTPYGSQLPECDASLIALTRCLYADDIDPTFEQPCAGYCARSAEAMCPADGSQELCALGCTVAAGVIPECTELFRAQIDCGQSAAASYSCDEVDGNAVLSGCDAEGLAYISCVFENAPSGS